MQVKDYKEGEHINAKLLVSSLVRGITNSLSVTDAAGFFQGH